ncbi:hypothetical protein PybrP1_001951 [[Pythium] brassicae (nom. inval.)]|nr:hypothetical protein PybrP1_001951 [[Pythium] brassicae (nom. inval.)]
MNTDVAVRECSARAVVDVGALDIRRLVNVEYPLADLGANVVLGHALERVKRRARARRRLEVPELVARLVEPLARAARAVELGLAKHVDGRVLLALELGVQARGAGLERRRERPRGESVVLRDALERAHDRAFEDRVVVLVRHRVAREEELVDLLAALGAAIQELAQLDNCLLHRVVALAAAKVAQSVANHLHVLEEVGLREHGRRARDRAGEERWVLELEPRRQVARVAAAEADPLGALAQPVLATQERVHAREVCERLLTREVAKVGKTHVLGRVRLAVVPVLHSDEQCAVLLGHRVDECAVRERARSHRTLTADRHEDGVVAAGPELLVHEVALLPVLALREWREVVKDRMLEVALLHRRLHFCGTLGAVEDVGGLPAEAAQLVRISSWREERECEYDCGSRARD